LTEAEILAMPWLIRLRCAVPTLWWLGRSDPGRALMCMGYQREFVYWLERHEQRLVTVLLEETH
jgi:hypothetical protein